ncbi:hypothetical protein KKC32_01570 [Patescibacteria group bacterium]|nr:hypothetical protein [bacterium]MBU1131924.1 hypothetical protein [Patescibacteria group bacterium]
MEIRKLSVKDYFIKTKDVNPGVSASVYRFFEISGKWFLSENQSNGIMEAMLGGVIVFPLKRMNFKEVKHSQMFVPLSVVANHEAASLFRKLSKEKTNAGVRNAWNFSEGVYALFRSETEVLAFSR